MKSLINDYRVRTIRHAMPNAIPIMYPEYSHVKSRPAR